MCTRVSRCLSVSPCPCRLPPREAPREREREREREIMLPIYHYRSGSAGDHFSRFTSVMKRFLPSSFTLPIYRFNYRLVARRDARTRESRRLEKCRAGSWNDVKSDLICPTTILIGNKRFVRSKIFAGNYRPSPINVTCCCGACF